jgi:hypothetical protein
MVVDVAKFVFMTGGPIRRAIMGIVTMWILFYSLCVNYVEQAHVGIAWNFATGNLALQSPGFYVTSPFTTVSRIDTRPARVCISTAGRGYNCKLAQFDPNFYAEFVATEGHYFYWWANRVSFNLGYKDEYRGMKDLIRGYAFGITPYSFIKILE